MKVVNQPIMKKDAMALVTGKPVFTNDKAQLPEAEAPFQ